MRACEAMSGRALAFCSGLCAVSCRTDRVNDMKRQRVASVADRGSWLVSSLSMMMQDADNAFCLYMRTTLQRNASIKQVMGLMEAVGRYNGSIDACTSLYVD